MSDASGPAGAPLRLRSLASWQASRVATVGARLTAVRLPLEARSDFAVLAALHEYGNLSQADIGRRLGLDRNNVNGIVTRLERAGHIERGVDASDRRRNVVALTEAGGRHLGVLQAHTDEVQDELLKGLDAGEREQLRVLLAKVLDAHPPQPA